eukprot:GEMP01005640.1.p1 GENE.GEMP01005640.1~~GEMP01005640.1.p1  ORF type:complete len:867 (+),score=257.07 GEMP01005640.1:158-2758(+)
MSSGSPVAWVATRTPSGFQQRPSSASVLPAFRASQGSNANGTQRPPIMVAGSGGRAGTRKADGGRNVNDSDGRKSARSTSSGKKNARDVLWGSSPDRRATTTSSDSVKTWPVTSKHMPSRLRQPSWSSARTVGYLGGDHKPGAQDVAEVARKSSADRRARKVWTKKSPGVRIGSEDRAEDVAVGGRAAGAAMDTRSLDSTLPRNIWDNIDVFHEEVEEAVRGHREKRKSAEEMMSEQEYSLFLEQQEEEEHTFWSSLESKELALQRLVTNMQLHRYDNNPAAFAVGTMRESFLSANTTSSRKLFSCPSFSSRLAPLADSSNTSPPGRPSSLQDSSSPPMLGGTALSTVLREQLIHEERRVREVQDQVRELEAQHAAHDARVQEELHAVREEIQAQKVERARLQAQQQHQQQQPAASTSVNAEISRLKDNVRAVRLEAANALGELQAAHEREFDIATALYQQELQAVREGHMVLRHSLYEHESLEDSPKVLREERRGTASRCNNVNMSPCFGTRGEHEGDDDMNDGRRDRLASSRDTKVQHLMQELNMKERTIQQLVTVLHKREPDGDPTGATKVVKYSRPVGPPRKEGNAMLRSGDAGSVVAGEDDLLAAIKPLRVLSTSSLHSLVSPRDDTVANAGTTPPRALHRATNPPLPPKATPRAPLASSPTSARPVIQLHPSPSPSPPSIQLLAFSPPHFGRSPVIPHLPSPTALGTPRSIYCTPRHHGGASYPPRALHPPIAFGVVRHSVPYNTSQTPPPLINRPGGGGGRPLTPRSNNVTPFYPLGVTRKVSTGGSTPTLRAQRTPPTSSSLSMPTCPPQRWGSVAMTAPVGNFGQVMNPISGSRRVRDSGGAPPMQQNRRLQPTARA